MNLIIVVHSRIKYARNDCMREMIRNRATTSTPRSENGSIDAVKLGREPRLSVSLFFHIFHVDDASIAEFQDAPHFLGATVSRMPGHRKFGTKRQKA